MIQGPPGSGKTWTSGRLIARLVDAGKRVGVASTSHRAIHKLLEEVVEGAAELGVTFRGLKKASDSKESALRGRRDRERLRQRRLPRLRAARRHGLALRRRASTTAQLDYLFIDEAGQVSLADALAMGTSARNLVLVGDPQQLGQVLQGSHPDGSEASVLEHLLDGAGDDPARPRGLPRDDLPAPPRRLRLHLGGVLRGPAAARPGHLDEDDAVRHRPALARVDHEGNRQESVEEARPRCGPRSSGSPQRASGSDEIKVVAPYNAQVDRLRAVLPAAVEVGTVDKFQGQQARVVFYSMASSSGEDVPRGLDFLFSRNRFNVAISRAECLAYLVCSPRLLEVDCRTIDHMRLANALCRFVELAQAV